MVMRGSKRKGVRYFGPYGHAYAIRETLDLLLRTFPIRTCSDNKLGRHQKLGRPCLLFHIEKCSGPCVRRDRPRRPTTCWWRELIDFLDGDTDAIVGRLETADARGGRRARVRAGRPPARPARRRAQGHRQAADGGGQGRGRRRDRHRRRRARGGRAGVLRAPGPGGGPQGLRDRQGRGRVARRAGRLGARGPLLRPAAAGRAQAGAGAGGVGRPRPVRAVADRAARGAGHHPGARSGATSGPCSRR